MAGRLNDAELADLIGAWLDTAVVQHSPLTVSKV
jgi:hypothetical protein